MEEEIARLQEENEAFANNFETLKEAHIKLQNENERLQAQVSKIAEEKLASERMHEEMLRSWKAELERKAFEFDELRSQVVPQRELELARLKVIEELDGPHREKCQALEREVERYQDMAMRIRRDHELLKLHLESTIQEHAKQLEELTLERDTAIKALTERNRFLENALDKQMDEDKVKTLQRENTELRNRMEALEEEIHDVRGAKEAIRVEREHLVAAHNAALNERELTIKNLFLEKDSLLRKAQQLESYHREGSQEQELLRNQVTTLETLLSQTRIELEQSQRMHQADKAMLQGALTERQHEWSAVRDDLVNHADSLSLRLEEMESLLAARLEQAELETVDRVQKVRAEEVDRRKRLEQERANLQQEVAALEAVKGDAQVALQDEVDQMTKELESVRGQLRNSEGECATLQDKSNRLVAEVAELRSDLERMGRNLQEVQAEYVRLQEMHQKLLHNESSATRQVEDLETKIRQLQDELLASLSIAETTKTQAAELVEIGKSKWHTDKNSLLTELQRKDDDINSLRTDLKRCIARSMKRKHKYQVRLKSALSELDSLKRAFAASSIPTGSTGLQR